jgi:hypothetical protein
MSIPWEVINDSSAYQIHKDFTTVGNGSVNILVRFPTTEEAGAEFAYTLDIDFLQCSDGMFKCEFSFPQSVESDGVALPIRSTNRLIPKTPNFLAYEGSATTAYPDPYKPITFYMGNAQAALQTSLLNATNLDIGGTGSVFAGGTDILLKFTNIDNVAANLVSSIVIRQTDIAKSRKAALG